LWDQEKGFVVVACKVAKKVLFATRDVAEEMVDAVGYRLGGDQVLGLGGGHEG
jgi:hypothetical protein